MRLLSVGLIIIFYSFGISVNAQPTNEESVLCKERAPEHLPPELPDPFDQWSIVICTENGQVLMAEAGSDGSIWFVHGTMQPFGLEAVPPIKARETLIKNHGAENMTFVNFAGGELVGESRNKVLKMYDLSFSSAPLDVEKIRIFQLDAVSVYNGIIYNLFFYVANDKPRHVLICINRCQVAAALDVLNLEEAKKRAESSEAY